MIIDKFRLLFFGSDRFSILILQHILKKRLCPVEVVTKPYTVLDNFCSSFHLTRHFWKHGLDHVDQDSYNLGLVASFGEMIDEKSVNRFEYGLFNVHPSLLPQYRGSTPIQSAIFDDLKETGCTIMRIPPVEKFDIGDIILQKKIQIAEREYAVDLRDRLAHVGAEMVEDFITNYEGCLINSRPQDGRKKSLAKKLSPEQGHLKFRTESSDLIDKKVRAYTGFIDIYVTCLAGLKVRLEGMIEPGKVEDLNLDCLLENLNDCDRVSPIEGETRIVIQAGVMFFHKIRRLLCIRCADRRWLAFMWATPYGKPKMSAADFYNGYLSKAQQSLRLTDS